MAENRYQLVVVGGGPGGYVAAIRAAQLGIQTALVEREALGGVCLNWGCIPTKALLKSAEVYSSFVHAADYGVTVDNVQVDIRAMVARSRAIANQLNAGVGHLLKKNKIDVIEGEARLLGGGRIQADCVATTCRARRCDPSHVQFPNKAHTGQRRRTLDRGRRARERAKGAEWYAYPYHHTFRTDPSRRTVGTSWSGRLRLRWT